MGAVLVVQVPELVEGTLLPSERPPGRRTRGDLEREVHALVASVLLRLAGVDALDPDAQLRPPHGQLRQAPRAGRCERLTVIRADGLRQPVRLEEFDEDAPYVLEARGVETDAGEKVARRTVHHRQRVARLPIGHLELALEVHAPYVVRLATRSERPRPRTDAVAAPTVRNHAVPLQDGADRARGRPGVLRPQRLQPLADRDRSPQRELSPLRQDQLHELGRCRVRAAVRTTGLLFDRRPLPRALEPRGPLVAGLSADAEQLAERRLANGSTAPLEDETTTLVHWTGLFPGHPLALAQLTVSVMSPV